MTDINIDETDRIPTLLVSEAVIAEHAEAARKYLLRKGAGDLIDALGLGGVIAK